MNEDGYPEEDELKQIQEWDWKDSIGLLEFVRERWMYADCGYWERDGLTYRISTGGWSGNESLIAALQENRPVWMFCWQSSRRGGHYEFEIPAALRKGE